MVITEAIIIFALMFVIHIISMVLHKKCSNVLASKGSPGKAVYVLITGIFSGILYFAYSGFTLEINGMCVLFAFLYGICSTIAGITITIYKYADMATVSVTKSSFSLILTSLVGFVIFSEPASASRIGKLILTLCVVFLVFMNSKMELGHSNKNDDLPLEVRRSNFIKFCLLIAVQIPVFIFGAYQSKMVAKYNLVPDLNSYYCLVNLFMVLFGTIWIAYLAHKDKNSISECISLVKSKSIFTILALLVIGTFTALLGVIFLKYVDISLYSPVNSALTFIGSALVSLMLREKIGKFIWLAVAVSVIAVII